MGEWYLANWGRFSNFFRADLPLKIVQGGKNTGFLTIFCKCDAFLRFCRVL